MARIHLPSDESANELWQLGWGCILRHIVSCFTADEGPADLNRDLLLLKPRRPKGSQFCERRLPLCMEASLAS